MANTCLTCRHPNVDEINAMLTRDLPLREITGRFQPVSKSGLQRHRENCIPGLFISKRGSMRKGLLSEIDELKAEIADLRREFAGNGQIRVQLLGKRLEIMDREAKLTGVYQQDARNKSDLARVASAYCQFLEDFPGVSQAEREHYLDMFARQSGFDRTTILSEMRATQ